MEAFGNAAILASHSAGLFYEVVAVTEAMTVRNNNSSRFATSWPLRCLVAETSQLLGRFVKWLNFQLEDERLIGQRTQPLERFGQSVEQWLSSFEV